MKFKDRISSMLPFEWEGVTVVSSYDSFELCKDAKLFPEKMARSGEVFFIYKQSVLGLRFKENGFEVTQMPLPLTSEPEPEV